MHQFAMIHSSRHPKFSDEGQIWTLILETYDPNGAIREHEGVGLESISGRFWCIVGINEPKEKQDHQ